MLAIIGLILYAVSAFLADSTLSDKPIYWVIVAASLAAIFFGSLVSEKDNDR